MLSGFFAFALALVRARALSLIFPRFHSAGEGFEGNIVESGVRADYASGDPSQNIPYRSDHGSVAGPRC